MKYTAVKISVIALLPLVLMGCFIVRQSTNEPVDNSTARTVNTTNFGQQDIWSVINNPTYHARYNVPAELSETTDAPEKSVFGNYSTFTLTVLALSGTTEQVQQEAVRLYPKFPALAKSTDKPWDVFTNGDATNQVRVFADGTYGVIMSFHDFPAAVVQQVQDTFEFTTPSEVLETFINTANKYSFTYPKNYQVYAMYDDHRKPEVADLVHLSIRRDAWDITVEVHKFAKGETFSTYLKNTFSLDSELTDSMSINGLKAYVYNGTLTTQRVGVINANGKAVVFDYEDNNRSVDVVNAFDSIMKSFKPL